MAANSAVVKLVPAKIKSTGTLSVAADASYAPNEFFASNGHTVIGMDADLTKALAELMGLKANVQNVTFDSIIPAIQAGKYDLGASSFTDTKAREKQVTFIDYFVAGTSFFTKASGGTAVSGLADLCGKTVAVEKGTTEETDAGTQSAKCKKAGKPGVTVLSYTDQNGANLALSSGRAQLVMADSPVAAYAVKKSNGQFKITGHDLRHCAVRAGGREEQRPGSGGTAGGKDADEGRHLHEDPHDLGDPERRPAGRAGEDQRRDLVGVKLWLG